MRHKRGITREVVLVGRYALKFPSLRTWWLFLEGLQCNMNEAERECLSDHFCRILFRVPGGFLIVMERAEPVEISDEEYYGFRDLNDMHVHVEHKSCSFGRISGRLVAVDYG